MGFLGGSNLSAERLQSDIKKVKALTKKPFGVGLLLPATLAKVALTRSEVRAELAIKFPKHVEFIRSLMREHGLDETAVDSEVVTTPEVIEAQLDIVFEEKIPAFVSGLGDPSRVVQRAGRGAMVVCGLAGSVPNAKRQQKAGVDYVITQGYEAGGHTGKIANFALIPQAVDCVKPTPIIAAGGISDGRGIAASLALGAVGVWIGTAFLVAEECQISPAMKKQIIKSSADDFDITRYNSGKSQRCYQNVILQAWKKSGLEPAPYPYQQILMSDFNAAASRANRWDLHANPAGQGAGMLTEIKPAREIMKDLVEGTIKALSELNGRADYART